MNNYAVRHTAADKKMNTPEVIVTADKTKTKEKKKSNDKRTLLIMSCISLLVMVIAVSSIYFVIKSNPDLVHTNDQTTQVSQENGFLNPNSIQHLEYDDFNITLKPVENSPVFITCGVVLMVIMAGSFLFVKIKEHREDD